MAAAIRAAPGTADGANASADLLFTTEVAVPPSGFSDGHTIWIVLLSGTFHAPTTPNLLATTPCVAQAADFNRMWAYINLDGTALGMTLWNEGDALPGCTRPTPAPGPPSPPPSATPPRCGLTVVPAGAPLHVIGPGDVDDWIPQEYEEVRDDCSGTLYELDPVSHQVLPGHAVPTD
jgi:hypothetical protein